MKLSNLRVLLALLFSLSLIAAACAGDEGTDTATEDESTESTEDDSTEDDSNEDGEMEDDSMEDDSMEEGDHDFSGTTVTITGSERSEEEAGAFQDALDQFSEETGIEITFAGSADWEAEINIQVEADNPPDISMFPQPGKLADFAAAGHVLPLPDDVTASVSENWSESWMGFGNADGVQYGVPAKSDLKSLVWYQPARFAELGYEVPETWDALKDLTTQAIADGVTPWCVGIESGQATGWPFTDWVEDLMLRFHGADVYDQWVAGEIPFSDERVIQVFNEIGELWGTDGAVFASGGSIAATAFGDNGQPLVEGDCLMHRQASFFAAFIPEGTPFADGSEGAVDVFYFPQVDDTRPVLGAGLLAGAFADRPEVWAVMEYIGSPEYANARQAAQAERKGGGLSGFLSAVKGADPSLYQPLEQSMLEVLATGEVVRFDGSDLMPSDVGAGTFWTEGTSFVNGDKTAEEAAEAIDASWP